MDIEEHTWISVEFVEDEQADRNVEDPKKSTSFQKLVVQDNTKIDRLRS